MNKQLFDIFRACNFAEERRHGVSSVAKIYDEETYIFSDYFIDVVIPFNKHENDDTTGTQLENLEEEIIKLIRNSEKISRKDLAIVLQKSEGSIRHHLKKLQEKEVIKHFGSDKGGYWEIIPKKED